MLKAKGCGSRANRNAASLQEAVADEIANGWLYSLASVFSRARSGLVAGLDGRRERGLERLAESLPLTRYGGRAWGLTSL
jgi:hypothetical protein